LRYNRTETDVISHYLSLRQQCIVNYSSLLISAPMYLSVKNNSAEESLCCYADINECNHNNGGCWEHSMCINTDGGYRCECQHGFESQGSTCVGKFLNSTQYLNFLHFRHDCAV